MSSKQTGRVWDHKFSKAQQSIMLAMADHANHDGTGIRPSVARIAWKTDYSERHVQRIIRQLEKVGVLVLVRKEDPAGGLAREYRFDWGKAKRKPDFEGRHNDDRGDMVSGVTPTSPELYRSRSTKESSPSDEKDRGKEVKTGSDQNEVKGSDQSSAYSSPASSDEEEEEKEKERTNYAGARAKKETRKAGGEKDGQREPCPAVEPEFDLEIPVHLRTEEWWEVWQMWKEERREKIKPPISKRAAKMQLKLMGKYHPKVAVEMMARSINGSWQGLFELKEWEPLMKKYGRHNYDEKVKNPAFSDGPRLKPAR